MLKILIVDDEMPAREELKYILSLLDETQIVGEAADAGQVLSLAAQMKPEVIFLDINMHGMNGLEAAKILRDVAPGCVIVFATAYEDYALQAFEIGAIDYVLKPFDEDRIRRTIERIGHYYAEANPDTELLPSDKEPSAARIQVQKLPVEKSGKIMMLAYENILYAYACLGSVKIVTANEEIDYNGSLTELEERLKDTHLLRVHKSYLVNMDKVKEVIPWFKGTYWLKMMEGGKTEIPVSKSQIKEIKTILGLK